jgi:hypothetical protein
VADEKDLSKKIGLTPGKAVLIGVLAVVFVVVIYIQFGSGGEEYSEEAVVAVEETSETASPEPPPTLASSRPTAAEAADGAKEKPTVVAAPAAEKDANGGKLTAIASLDSERWKAPEVDSIVEYDPFALPLAFPQPVRVVDSEGLTSEGIVAAEAATRANQLADAVANLHTELESLRQRGVSVIVKQHDKYVAMIGDRTVHVGDEINGFTVTAIEADGVRVEKKVQE